MSRTATFFAFILFLKGGSCGSGAPTDMPQGALPLQTGSPWPKFRNNGAQDGKSDVKPQPGGRFFGFKTGAGIFSSPVVGADGTIYVGSADRYFYALNSDGTVRWKLLCGEIIDSAALLDDRGRVYFGSGDGSLRAVDAATGAPVFTFSADPPQVNQAFINWFEGNVAISPQGSLYVPNDNFFLYSIDRDAGTALWKRRMPDQTWSLPAVDQRAGTLYLGNNNVVSFLGSNVYSINADGSDGWSYFTLGTVAASPLLTADQMVVGSFDGFVYAFDNATGNQRWSFGTLDHIYASPARLSDGTLVQPSADGVIYGLAPGDGSLRFTYLGREPIRSSPAVDGDDNIYVGTGDGHLLVLNPDGTRRWALKLIADDRNDLNSSPALGATAVYIGGESGELFSVPYDYCLFATGMADPRCEIGAGPPLADGASLDYIGGFGKILDPPPPALDPNAPLTFGFSLRRAGQPVLAYLDAANVTVTVDPKTAVKTEVSGDGKFLTLTPLSGFVAGPDGTVHINVTAAYLTEPDRQGLKLSGGMPGGTASIALTAALNAPPPQPAQLLAPSQPGDPASTFEVARLALPLPSLLPSYNQIGFDSLRYLIGLVELQGGQGVGWMVGARLLADANTTEIDPDSRALLPLAVTWDGGFLTLQNQDGLRVVVMNATIPFKSFRLAAALNSDGRATSYVSITGSTICGQVPVYGLFLQQLGLCNPTTDVMTVAGAANFNPFGSGATTGPSGLGNVSFTASSTQIVATLSGTTLQASQHLAAILLVDPATGKPITLDYGLSTDKSADASGLLKTVTLSLDASVVLPATVRAYLMIDTYPAAKALLMPS